MGNITEKAHFLQHGFAEQLRALDETTPPKWGKMNVRQMIEHMADSVRIANGRKPVPVINEEEKITKLQNFLMSEIPFKENTPNALLPDTPPAVRLATKEEAIKELEAEFSHFFDVYSKNNEHKIANPFFGHLGYDQQVQLLHKHAVHHLKQFGVE